jgi:hypothetical protein
MIFGVSDRISKCDGVARERMRREEDGCSVLHLRAASRRSFEVPRGEKTDDPIEDTKVGRKIKHECGPMDVNNRQTANHDGRRLG